MSLVVDPPRHCQPRPVQRLEFFCRATSASTAPCTSKRMCCPTHFASCCAPCQPLLRAFSGWIRYPPPTPVRFSVSIARGSGGGLFPNSLLARQESLFVKREAFRIRNAQRFRGGLVFKAHKLFVSLNLRLESNKGEEEDSQESRYKPCQDRVYQTVV